MASNNIIKNTAIYAVGDIIPKIVNFIFFPILTKYLTPDDYGIINYVNSLNAFVLVFSVLCLNTYYMVSYNKVEDVNDRKRMLGSLSLFVISLNVFITILLFLFGKSIFSLISENIPFYPYIVIGLLINLFNSLAVLPIATLRMEEEVKNFTIINIAKAVLMTVGTFVVVSCIHASAVYALLTQMIVILIFSVIFILTTYKYSFLCFDIRYIKKGLKFSLPLVPGTLAYYAVTMSDRIFISKYLSLFDLGIYSTASTLALVLVTISSCAYKAFEPYIFKLPNDEYRNERIIKLFKNYFFIVLFLSLCISLFSKQFLLFFASPDYLISHKYVPLLLVGTIFTSLSLLFSTVIIANGLTKINSLISIIGGILSIILNLFLLRFGVVFACITSMLSLGVMFYLNVYYSKLKFSWISYFFLFALIYVIQIPFFVLELNVFVDLIFKTVLVLIIGFFLYSKSDFKLHLLKNNSILG